MIDVNKWIGYISISIVMVFGILFVSGMIGDFDLSLRLTVGLIVLVYVLVRIGMLYMTQNRKAKKRSTMRCSISDIKNENGERGESNNA